MFITGCDQYTREFYDNLGMPQNDNTEAPLDNFEIRTRNKFIPKKDKLLNDFMEHKLGGGRVPSQKQFLENDRKVLISTSFSISYFFPFRFFVSIAKVALLTSSIITLLTILSKSVKSISQTGNNIIIILSLS